MINILLLIISTVLWVFCFKYIDKILGKYSKYSPMIMGFLGGCFGFFLSESIKYIIGVNTILF